jgi:hypothetical protein
VRGTASIQVRLRRAVSDARSSMPADPASRFAGPSDAARAPRLVEADRALAFCVVYAPADEPVVAVEPVTHETDAFNREAAGARGTGMRVLRPGEAFSCTMRIAARALAAR